MHRPTSRLAMRSLLMVALLGVVGCGRENPVQPDPAIQPNPKSPSKGDPVSRGPGDLIPLEGVQKARPRR